MPNLVSKEESVILQPLAIALLQKSLEKNSGEVNTLTITSFLFLSK